MCGHPAAPGTRGQDDGASKAAAPWAAAAATIRCSVVALDGVAAGPAQCRVECLRERPLFERQVLLDGGEGGGPGAAGE